MSEELKNVEVENALTTVFEKIEELNERFDTVDNTASTALSVARAAKSAIDNANFAPSNGFDLAMSVIGRVAGVVIMGMVTWGVVKVAQARWGRNPVKETSVHHDHKDGSWTIETTREYEDE